ncbi:MAG TPA: DotU family type IV/VI secretion system protein [Gemmatimonadaceae bacterium]|nr:DotU family type IV/VI secretion system protein [Gemmatimonadaceae bacterium]
MTQSSSAPSPADGQGGTSVRRGQLALALQEVLTATVRLRANRQVAADADSFRRHVKQVMAAAEQEARRAGYSDDQIRLALYAVVAFLDESVLNSTQPMFADWPRRPLQDEIFGGHLGGELFFRNVQALLAQPDSEDLADLLEVFQLCMLLGFHGRYSASDHGELHMLMSRVAEKIARIRGPFGELSPAWAPPPGEIPTPRGDRWARRLAVAAVALVVVAGALFATYRVSLDGGITELHALAPRIVR